MGSLPGLGGATKRRDSLTQTTTETVGQWYEFAPRPEIAHIERGGCPGPERPHEASRRERFGAPLYRAIGSAAWREAGTHATRCVREPAPGSAESSGLAAVRGR